MFYIFCTCKVKYNMCQTQGKQAKCGPPSIYAVMLCFELCRGKCFSTQLPKFTLVESGLHSQKPSENNTAPQPVTINIFLWAVRSQMEIRTTTLISRLRQLAATSAAARIAAREVTGAVTWSAATWPAATWSAAQAATAWLVHARIARSPDNWKKKTLFVHPNSASKYCCV